MKTLQETCDKKVHNTITGIYRAKATQRMILITDQLKQKEGKIVSIAQEFSMEDL